MDITRRTDYAIRLIAAIINKGVPLSVREAAELQNVPYAFARSIQYDLAQSGYIHSVRGTRGGMTLAKNYEKITLLELIEAVQGPVNVSICVASPGWCKREELCEFHAVWEGANNLLRDYLSSVTIKELLQGKQAHLTREFASHTSHTGHAGHANHASHAGHAGNANHAGHTGHAKAAHSQKTQE